MEITFFTLLVWVLDEIRERQQNLVRTIQWNRSEWSREWTSELRPHLFFLLWISLISGITYRSSLLNLTVFAIKHNLPLFDKGITNLNWNTFQIMDNLPINQIDLYQDGIGCSLNSRWPIIRDKRYIGIIENKQKINVLDYKYFYEIKSRPFFQNNDCQDIFPQKLQGYNLINLTGKTFLFKSNSPLSNSPVINYKKLNLNRSKKIPSYFWETDKFNNTLIKVQPYKKALQPNFLNNHFVDMNDSAVFNEFEKIRFTEQVLKLNEAQWVSTRSKYNNTLSEDFHSTQKPKLFLDEYLIKLKLPNALSRTTRSLLEIRDHSVNIEKEINKFIWLWEYDIDKKSNLNFYLLPSIKTNLVNLYAKFYTSIHYLDNALENFQGLKSVNKLESKKISQSNHYYLPSFNLESSNEVIKYDTKNLKNNLLGANFWLIDQIYCKINNFYKSNNSFQANLNLQDILKLKSLVKKVPLNLEVNTLKIKSKMNLFHFQKIKKLNQTRNSLLQTKGINNNQFIFQIISPLRLMSGYKYPDSTISPLKFFENFMWIPIPPNSGIVKFNTNNLITPPTFKYEYSATSIDDFEKNDVHQLIKSLVLFDRPRLCNNLEFEFWNTNLIKNYQQNYLLDSKNIFFGNNFSQDSGTIYIGSSLFLPTDELSHSFVKNKKLIHKIGIDNSLGQISTTLLNDHDNETVGIIDNKYFLSENYNGNLIQKYSKTNTNLIKIYSHFPVNFSYLDTTWNNYNFSHGGIYQSLGKIHWKDRFDQKNLDLLASFRKLIPREWIPRAFRVSTHKLTEPITEKSWMLIWKLYFAFIVFQFLVKIQSDLQSSHLDLLIDSDGNYSPNILYPYNNPKRLADLGGIQNIISEITSIIWFLRNSGRYSQRGLPIPRGILLVGPSGTGKTLLAKAVAGESKVPLLAASGSEFHDPSKGSGSLRLETLFKKARELSPCIVFIDEIDTLGQKRTNLLSDPTDTTDLLESISQKSYTKWPIESNDLLEKHVSNHELSESSSPIQKEEGNVLMQFLIEMDGLYSRKGVVVIGASNRADVLDPAFTRPGRFDRIMHIDLPNSTQRIDILKVYTRRVKTNDSIEWNYITERTKGFSSADLAAVMNESILYALSRNTLQSIESIEWGISKVTTYSTPILDSATVNDALLRRLAYSQAGKTLVSHLLKNFPDIVRTLLWPETKHVRHIANEGIIQYSKFDLLQRSELELRLVVFCSSKAADCLAFPNEIYHSDISSEDLFYATTTAYFMIRHWYLYTYALCPAMTLDRKQVIEQTFESHTLWLKEITELITSHSSSAENWWRIFLPDPNISPLNKEYVPEDLYIYSNKLNLSLTQSFEDLLVRSLIQSSFILSYKLLFEFHELLEIIATTLFEKKTLREYQIKSLIHDFITKNKS